METENALNESMERYFVDGGMEQHCVQGGMEQHFVMNNDELVDVLPVVVYDEKNAPELFQTDEEIAQEFLENLEHHFDIGNDDEE